MNELRIKSAAEYRREEVTVGTAAKEDLQAKAVEFINNTITPKIEDKIANPGKYTTTSKHLSFKVDHYPSNVFVAEVAALLTPLGFEVYESHDGGGMYATLEVAWEEPKPVVRRSVFMRG